MEAGKILIGRKEWCEFPGLGIKKIRAKVDTGAKTSALHAENIHLVKKSGGDYVSFTLALFSDEKDSHHLCTYPITDVREITSSNGKKETRYVITTTLVVGVITKDIELTLTNRNLMRYNLLLGREALTPDFIIDPSKTYLLKQPRSAVS